MQPLSVQDSICSNRKLERIGLAIQKPQLERNVEYIPFLLWIVELECDPKQPDRSQAWGAIHQYLRIILKG
jgi:hypothetical protein